MFEKYITINERGQLVLPKNIRKIANLDKRKQLKIEFDAKHNKIILEPIKSFTEQLKGSARHLIPENEVDSYIDDLRGERG